MEVMKYEEVLKKNYPRNYEIKKTTMEALNDISQKYDIKFIQCGNYPQLWIDENNPIILYEVISK